MTVSMNLPSGPHSSSLPIHDLLWCKCQVSAGIFGSWWESSALKEKPRVPVRIGASQILVLSDAKSEGWEKFGNISL